MLKTFFTFVIFTALLIIITPSNTTAQTIKVGLEPFPPFIIDKNTGYTIELLKEVEAISDLKFEIFIMSYTRAKRWLKTGHMDMMGHTPYQVETEEFYSYAQELSFKILTISDLYTKDKSNFNDISKLTIGVPRGNEEFLSELLNLPVENFYLGELTNLLKMLDAGRIDAFWFERASTMLTMKELKISNVHYMKSPVEQIPAGLAVRNDKKGTQLMKKMDKYFSLIDKKKILKGYNEYLELPNKGIFLLDKVLVID